LIDFVSPNKGISAFPASISDNIMERWEELFMHC